MYSKIALLILFLAIVVLGTLLSRQQKHDGFIDSGFCARKMPTDFANCSRYYPQLAYANMLKGMNDNEQEEKVNEHIRVHAELMKLEPNTYPNLSTHQQFRAIYKHLKGSSTENKGQDGVEDGVQTVRESTRVMGKLASICPSSAHYDADGKIRIEPSGHSFNTMTDYTNYIASFYAMNSYCKPIGPVIAYSGPQPGLLGGMYNHNDNYNDRSVLNKALSFLFDTSDERQMTQMNEGTSGEIPVHTFQVPPPGEQTFSKTRINSLDDYEFNRVFELENRPRMAELSKNVKNNLLNAMQLDWPTLPYSSDKKAKLEEQFVDARMQDGFREPKSGVFFKNMEGVEIAPPNHEATAAREAKILSAYQPTDITKHVVDDEYERVAKVVAQQYSTDPDWEPVVEKRGPHQYAVTELKPRRKKNDEDIVWEGEANISIADAKQQGFLESGTVKPNSMSIQDNLADPFFAKTGVADHSNDRFWKYSDFNAWTPGLERMFAPTDPTNEWK